MDFSYVAYTEDNKMVKGRVSALDEEAAGDLLNYGGYRVVSLKQAVPFINKEKLLARFSRVKPNEIIMFSRQLALLLESGTDIVTSLDLLQEQADNEIMRKTISEVAADIRAGSSLSKSISRHSRAFPPMYHRSLAAGEQGGNLEVVLRRMAEHMERSATTEKQIKGAMTYPVIVVLVAIVVVGVLTTFVLPAFMGMYGQFNVELPTSTRILLGISDFAEQYGLYLLLAFLAAVLGGYAYIRTPAGKFWWDSKLLSMPVIGRIIHLSELARACRTMALLLKIGLPLPEVMTITSQNSSNKAMIASLNGVQEEMIRGEGLSRPMAKRKLFLPLMTQMTRVGEETGSLDNTLDTVADSFEMEAGDKTRAAVALVQPVMTIVIGLVVLFIVLAMVEAMYSLYGQM